MQRCIPPRLWPRPPHRTPPTRTDVGDPPAKSVVDVVRYLSTDATLLGVLLIDHRLAIRTDEPTATLVQPLTSIPPALSSVAPITDADYEMPTLTACTLAGGDDRMPATSAPLHVYTEVGDNEEIPCQYGCGYVCQAKHHSELQLHEASCKAFYTAPDAVSGGTAA